MNTKMLQIKKLKEKILDIDFVLSGTLRLVYQKCGTATCKCTSGKNKDKHGPYTYWDRKIQGVSVTTSVNKKQKLFIQKGIKNRKKLEKLVQKMMKIGEKLPAEL